MDIKKIIKKVTDVLNVIIDNNIDGFKNDDSFKVRPGYGYDKFYLTQVDGSYDMSLQGLIHYIMYDVGIYKDILNKKQYADMENVIKESPASIYSPDELEDENYPELQYDMLDPIYWESIAFVGKRLIELGFDVKDDFSDYLD